MSEQLPPEDAPGTTAELERRRYEARRRLWGRGVLSWKFEDRPWCKDLYDFVRKAWGLAGFLFAMMHRRGGKSTTAIIVGIEECLREANTRVAIVCDTKEQAQAICDESMSELLLDCPKELQPRKIKNDFVYVFDHNKSKIVILPSNGTNWKKFRGRKFRFVIITEACFVGKLDTIVKMMLPTLRDVTGRVSGTMLLESTPPDEAGHPSEDMWAEAQLDGRAFFLPLSANTHAHPNFVALAQKDSGGADSVAYKREYELQFVFEDESTVLPEFSQAAAFDGVDGKPPIVREVTRPNGSDRYGAMDPGGADLTGNVWGFFHFEKNMLVIEDELALVNMTSDDLAKKVRAKELALWGANPDGRLLRFADNNAKILLYDLLRLHGLRYTATAKDNKDAQINQLRVMLRDGLIVIHPRCKLLIKTMRMAKRHKQVRKGFQHGEEIGHADLLDALLYLVRNVRRHAMPAASPQAPMAVRDVLPAKRQTAQADQGLAQALGLRRRRRW